MKLTIFYSWQSTTEESFNRHFIKKCIEKAVASLKITRKLKDVKFEIQESTSDLSGTPDIVQIIESRIKECDIFIGDLTIVNSYFKIEKFIRKILKKKLIYQPNSNVLIEYGRALVCPGEESVIGVMNIIYGKPNLLPFNINQKRWPEQYTLNRSKDKEKACMDLTKKLEDAIRLAALEAIKKTNSRYKPFIRFSEHKKEPKNQEGFYDNKFIRDVQRKIIENKDNIRILGLSGLGKTRIVFESFKHSEELSNKYLYCDTYITDSSSILAAIEKVINDKDKAYLVVDNCAEELRDQILSLKSRKQSQLPLVTIYNQPEEKESDKYKCSYIKIHPRSMDEVVEDILQKKGKNIKDDDLKIIREFSGGIPLMAKLLVDSINDGEEHIGRLGNEDLLSKLLNTKKDLDEWKILQALSLFDFVGFEESASDDLKLLATNVNITPINGEESVKINRFYEVIQKYSKREIFEKQGRLISLRPKALAFYLADDWFEACHPERIEAVFKSIQEHPNAKLLSESMCRQIRYLSYSDKAKELVERLIAAHGPFGNAKVVNTELGSRFFRAFVEMNPKAVADSLFRMFGTMSIEELKQIDEGRRNLVWTLEKLCFDKDTFEKGAKLMMSFAAAENETWANNATGEFIHLFQIALPGTMANFEERLLIIEWGLNQEDEYKKIAIKAINSAFQTQHFSYESGAEIQGTKKLEHYKPKDNKEVESYWSSLLTLINTEISKGKTDINELCFKALSENLRPLIQVGAYNLIIPVVENVILIKNNDWDNMLDSLYFVLKHDSKMLTEVRKERIHRNIALLTKQDFVSQFIEVRKERNSWNVEYTFDESFNIKQEQYTKLAIEFVEKGYCSKQILSSLYADIDSFSTPFGYTIANVIKEDFEKTKAFINTSIEALNDINSFNPFILIDFSKGLNDEGIAYLTDSLTNNSKLSYLLFPVLGARNTELNKLSALFSLIDSNPSLIERFHAFFTNYCLTPEQDKPLAELLKRIKQYGIKGLNTAISIASSFLYSEENIKNYVSLSNFAEDTILNDISSGNIEEISSENLFRLLKKLLDKSYRPCLAKHINKVLIAISDVSVSFSYNHNYEQLYTLILDKYFDDIWDDLSKALLSDDSEYLKFYHLKHLLGARASSFSSSGGLLFMADNTEQIRSWCDNNPEIAPERLASMVPLYQGDEFHPLVNYLLDKYGNNDRMLHSLSASLGSYSCVGSVIPFFEHKKKALENLLSHCNRVVVEWAKSEIEYTQKDIEREQQKEDEEKFLYG